MTFNYQSNTDSYDMGNLLNEHLISVSISIQNSMHRISLFAHYSNYLTNVSPLSSFFFSPVSPSGVHKIIEGFKSKISHINTYSIKIPKYLSRLISPVLWELINKSLITGIFPGLFKRACVTSVLKRCSDKNCHKIFYQRFFFVNCSEYQLLFSCRSSGAQDFERVGECGTVMHWNLYAYWNWC